MLTPNGLCLSQHINTSNKQIRYASPYRYIMPPSSYYEMPQ